MSHLHPFGTVCASVVSLLFASSGFANDTSIDLTYTRFINRLSENTGTVTIPVPPFGSGSGFIVDKTVVNVRSVTLDWDDTTDTLTVGTPTDIATTPGADGILFGPDGDLLVGGQTNEVHKVDPSDGSFTTAALPAGAESFHLAMDPGLNKLWTSDQPDDQITEVSLNFGSTIVSHAVTGDTVTQIGFAPQLTAANPNLAYYTNSDRNGVGNFGILDMSSGTFVATPKIVGQAGAHSFAYDAATGDVILFGDHTILQIDVTTDPLNPTIKSTRDLSAELNALTNSLLLDIQVTSPISTLLSNFEVANLIGLELRVMDQGSVDGDMHLVAAVNSGHLVFIDYSATGLVEDGTLALDGGLLPFLDLYLDDIVPLSGAGSIPEPASATLLLSALGLLAVRRH
ncbi:MAG: hypothetical protein R3C45_08930 [Phycisphaerales bacterium]